MAIPTLTPEQIRTWSREQKDRWWLENVYRGSMPQLTLRAAVTGFILGGLLSATNLYIGAKTGWTLGVGLTSVILAFAMFRALTAAGLRDMTILENNCTQSIATAAGYMTGPLISGMAAYMWVQNQTIPLYQMFWFNVVLSVLGVLVAFPMKRRFINDEQHPFPEGQACGVVLDALYTSDAAVGVFKAKVLTIAALAAGGLKFLSSENIQHLIQEKWAGLSKVWMIPESLDEWYYTLAAQGKLPLPKLAGVPLRDLGLTATLDLAMFGAGGLMGIKSAANLLLGMLLNFVVIVPIMIASGEILPKSGSFEDENAVFGRAHVVNTWALWWGIAMMVTAAMTGLFAKPQLIISAFTNVFSKKGKVGAGGTAGADVLGDIEMPLWISFVGIPLVGAVGVWMAHEWFGVSWIFGASAIPLIIVLTLIAANSTALTSITPTGSLSKIPQFIFGSLDPKHPPTNLMTGVMCVEVASNASNLLMDIKPGYMLGAKPRQQAIGHCIGIIAGALASTPLFYLLFLPKWSPESGQKIQDAMVTEQFSFPSAMQWKGVSDLVASIFGGETQQSLLKPSIVTSMIIAAVVGLVFEVLRTKFKKFPLSPMAIGLGVVIPPDSTLAMAAGAGFFWLMHKIYAASRSQDGQDSFGKRLWVDSHEPLCAGIVAGAALIGIADALVRAFAL